jgi:hypothetical protein
MDVAFLGHVVQYAWPSWRTRQKMGSVSMAALRTDIEIKRLSIKLKNKYIL